MIKHRQVRNQRKVPQHDKGICEKPSNIILNGERLKAFFLKSRTKQECHSCYYYSILYQMKILARSIKEKKKRREKRNKMYQN